jgi:hypothetical protein
VKVYTLSLARASFHTFRVQMRGFRDPCVVWMELSLCNFLDDPVHEFGLCTAAVCDGPDLYYVPPQLTHQDGRGRSASDVL